MGEEVLVSEQRIKAGLDFLHGFNGDRPVSVAFWLNPAESDSLYLYVASDQINDSNIDVAYGEVLQRLLNGRKRNPWLDPFQIKLLNTSDPVASDAIRIRDRYSVDEPIPYNGAALGGVSIGGALIYPPLSAAPSTASVR